MQVEDPETQKLTLRLMDDESVEKSEYIGSAGLSIKEVNFSIFIVFLFYFLKRSCFLSSQTTTYISVVCGWVYI